jgi:dGTPase
MMNWKTLLQPKRLHALQNPNLNDIRSEFERDFDRIVFSHPFRRLQDKTQVHPMPIYDFVHNRLTHSLEVSSVARSLGKRVGLEIMSQNPELRQEGFTNHDLGAVAAAAALAHDVGNPPFGHSGESSISDYFRHSALSDEIRSQVSEHEWADLTNFEGNAQGFRILTRPEEGLKLTMPVLAGFTKYPCISHLSERNKSKCSQKKYGFFKNELPYYEQIANELGIVRHSDGVAARDTSYKFAPAGAHNQSDPAWARHPLAFLVEAADDICYSIIDLEDGCGLGLVSYESTESLLGAIMKDRFDKKKLATMTSRTEKVAVLRAITINVLVEEASRVFLANEAAILSGTFDQPLVDLVPSKDVLEEIRKVSITKIYQSQQVLEKEAAGFEVLEGLMHSFTTAVYVEHTNQESRPRRHQNVLRLLPETYRLRIKTETQLYEKLLIITDFVSGMTDSNALQLFQTLRGIVLPGK